MSNVDGYILTFFCDSLPQNFAILSILVRLLFVSRGNFVHVWLLIHIIFIFFINSSRLFICRRCNLYWCRSWSSLYCILYLFVIILCIFVWLFWSWDISVEYFSQKESSSFLFDLVFHIFCSIIIVFWVLNVLLI